MINIRTPFQFERRGGHFTPPKFEGGHPLHGKGVLSTTLSIASPERSKSARIDGLQPYQSRMWANFQRYQIHTRKCIIGSGPTRAGRSIWENLHLVASNSIQAPISATNLLANLRTEQAFCSWVSSHRSTFVCHKRECSLPVSVCLLQFRDWRLLHPLHDSN